jgi:superfamily II DNA/RNA helicase
MTDWNDSKVEDRLVPGYLCALPFGPSNRLLDEKESAVHRTGRDGRARHLGVFALLITAIPPGGRLHAGQTQIALAIKMHRIGKKTMLFPEILGLIRPDEIRGETLNILRELS